MLSLVMAVGLITVAFPVKAYAATITVTYDGNGKMLTGWQQINGKWYYLNPVSNGSLGLCYVNTTTPDGYQVGADGARIQ